MEKKVLVYLKVLYKWGTTCLISLLLWLFCIRNHRSEAVLAIAFLAILIYIYSSSADRFERRPRIGSGTPILLFLGGFFTRYLYCDYVNTINSQVSDFADILYRASAGFGDYPEYYRFFPHKFYYAYILHELGIYKQEDVYLFACAVLAFVPVLLYMIGKRIRGEGLGLAAALIYILWPAQLIYSSVVTEEHIASAGTALTVFMLLDAEKRLDDCDDLPLRKIVLMLLECAAAGGLLGFLTFFKDWGVIVLVALTICTVPLVMQYKGRRRAMLIGGVGLVIVFRLIFSSGMLLKAERELGGDVAEATVIAHMFESLDPNGWGGWDPDRMAEYMQIVRDHDWDFDSANAEAISILKSRIAVSPERMPGLLYSKGVSAYGDDSALLWWAVDAEWNQDWFNYFRGSISVLYYACGLWYVLAVILLIVAAFMCKDRGIFFILLIILGAVLAGLLVESQGRYKYSLEPLWCLPVGYALCRLCETVSGIRSRGSGGK